ncbi:MAG: PEP-CTERM sorting domain-containing protein [Candidatus Auribacterota bacterium]
MKKSVWMIVVIGTLCWVAQSTAATISFTSVHGSIKKNGSVYSLYDQPYIAAISANHNLGLMRGDAEFDLSALYATGVPAGSIESIWFLNGGGTYTQDTYLDICKLDRSLADGIISGIQAEYDSVSTVLLDQVSPSSLNLANQVQIPIESFLQEIRNGDQWIGVLVKVDVSQELSTSKLWFMSNLRMYITYDEHWAWIYHAGETFAQDWTEAEISQLTELWDTSGDSIEIDGETWYYTNDDELFTGHTLGDAWTDESGQKFIYLGSGLTSFGTPSAIPEPATVVLILAGIAGLIRKKITQR